MRPPVEPSGVGTPDLGWQQSGRRGRAAAARTSTTPAETLAGTQASPRQHRPQRGKANASASATSRV